MTEVIKKNLAPPEPEDWVKIYSILCRHYRKLPHELEECTIPELSLMLWALRDDKENKTTLNAESSPEDVAEFNSKVSDIYNERQRYLSLSPIEKLQEAYEQYG